MSLQSHDPAPTPETSSYRGNFGEDGRQVKSLGEVRREVEGEREREKVKSLL
ncbi:hypothetical protein BDV10DRAFT_169675 [Aspergillus recurvatus]